MDIAFHIFKWRKYIKNFFQKIWFPKLKVLSKEDSLAILLEKKISISRFGDGEIRLMNHENIEFQDFDPELRRRLIEIACSNNNQHAVCISPVFETLRNLDHKEQYFWRLHLADYRKIWVKYFNVRVRYLSTFLTRPYMPYKNKLNAGFYFAASKRIWDGKNILIIEGCQTRFGVNNTLLDNARSVVRIICPAKNAYNSYTLIMSAAKKAFTDHLVLVALGPTATVLCYDLSFYGIQAIDIGHLDIEFEWFLKKTIVKVEVEGKYTNEVVYDKTHIENIICDAYNKQIIQVIN